ncbi:BMC domain-containing protein [Clostridium sp. MSJ-11]|uniref:BMC domain-containing protein n=1 Tax=Clostridium mobile TaxID=2841512 RepID=A0ABS6EE34_9CLOT|nr:BMC domain-containing protein [Clostridium mobile]MBU5483298.1 BMC domain-containing protein [Clostridium mobile]
MKALGLIETRGLLAAIESADTMLKSADVSIFDKTYVGGGLVSVAVTGDVGAVKVAVEAGVVAVKRLDSSLLVSEHVIPRPHEELDSIIGIKNTTENIQEISNHTGESNVIMDNPIDKSSKDENNTDSSENVIPHSHEELDSMVEVKDTTIGIDNLNNNDNDTENIQEISNHTGESNVIMDNPVDENSKGGNKTDSSEMDLKNLQKETVDKLVKDNGIEKAIEVLNKLKLIKLRNLARQYNDLKITDEVISKASKKLLITKIRAYYK